MDNVVYWAIEAPKHSKFAELFDSLLLLRNRREFAECVHVSLFVSSIPAVEKTPRRRWISWHAKSHCTVSEPECDDLFLIISNNVDYLSVSGHLQILQFSYLITQRDCGSVCRIAQLLENLSLVLFGVLCCVGILPTCYLKWHSFVPPIPT